MWLTQNNFLTYFWWWLGNDRISSIWQCLRQIALYSKTTNNAAHSIRTLFPRNWRSIHSGRLSKRDLRCLLCRRTVQPSRILFDCCSVQRPCSDQWKLVNSLTDILVEEINVKHLPVYTTKPPKKLPNMFRRCSSWCWTWRWTVFNCIRMLMHSPLYWTYRAMFA